MKRTSFRKPPSKQDLRDGLGRDVDAFLEGGGAIERVDQGATALEGRSAPLRAPLFTEPRAERTPVDDVVAAVDARRKQRLKRSPVLKRSRKPRPRERIIYDDFGEALRTVWVED